MSDTEKLERAIINILSNAIRHAHSKVEIRCDVSEKEIEIAIHDDGDGIDEKDLPHLFERFYKGENGSSGLGLAISKDIVTGLGGRITAENMLKPQHGAKFTIQMTR